MNDIFELKGKYDEIIFTGVKNTFYLKKINRNMITLISRDTNQSYNINFREMGYLSPDQAIKELNKIIYKSESTEGATVQDLVDSYELEDKLEAHSTVKIAWAVDTYFTGHFLEPFISKIDNYFLEPNSNEDITIYGYNFCSHTEVEVSGQIVNTIEYVNPQTLIVNITVDDKIGNFDVKVINNKLFYLLVSSIEVGIRSLETVTWKNSSSNILLEDGKITRNAGYGWNEGAISSKAISYSNGYMEFTPIFNESANNRAMIGLSYVNTTYSYSDIQYALYLSNRNLYIYNSGSNLKSLGTWEDGDVFKIELKDDKILYKKNNIYIFHIDIREIFFPLFVDCTIYDKGYYFNDVKLFGKLVSI